MERQVSPGAVVVVLIIFVMIMLLAWYLIYGKNIEATKQPASAGGNDMCFACGGTGERLSTPPGEEWARMLPCVYCGGDGKR